MQPTLPQYVYYTIFFNKVLWTLRVGNLSHRIVQHGTTYEKFMSKYHG